MRDKIIFTAVVTAIVTLLVAPLIVWIAKRTGARVGRGVTQLWHRIRTDRAVEKTYRRKVASDLLRLQILQMSEAKTLTSVYVPLRLAAWTSPALRTATFQEGALYSVEEALSSFPQISILGYPGAGKTTVTSHALASLAEGSMRPKAHKWFPLFLSIRELKPYLDNNDSDPTSLINYFTSSLGRYGFRDPQRVLNRHLAKGDCVIVFDGLDELADRHGTLQKRLGSAIEALISRIADGNRVIVTSRPVGYEPAWFSGFAVFEMTEFDTERVDKFVTGWFSDDPERGALLREQLKTNDRLRRVVANPLMLAIVCFVRASDTSDEPSVPHRRSDLYERCVAALTADWDRSRGVVRDADFTPEQIETVVANVAFDALRNGVSDFTRERLLANLRLHMPKAGLRRFDDRRLLTEIEEHTGLLREKYHDVFAFVHLTFHEYLAARVIAERVILGIDRGAVRVELRDVLAQVGDPRWAEPIALAASILDGSPELIEAIFEEYGRDESPDAILLLANCLRDTDLAAAVADERAYEMRETILTGLVALTRSRVGDPGLPAVAASDPTDQTSTIVAAQEAMTSMGEGNILRFIQTRLRLQSSDTGTRPRLVAALGALLGASATNDLLELSQNSIEPAPVRVAALRALARNVDALADSAERESVAAAIAAGLESDEDEMRDAVAAALMALDTPSARERLQDALERDRLDPVIGERVRRRLLARGVMAGVGVASADMVAIRQRELEALHAILRESHIAFIQGQSGVGKTALALHLAQDDAYEGRLVVSGSSNMTVDQLKSLIASEIQESPSDSDDLPGARSILVVEEADQLSAAVLTWLVESARSAGNVADVLLVVRRMPVAGLNGVSLSQLDRGAAIELIRHYATTRDYVLSDAAVERVADLGGGSLLLLQYLLARLGAGGDLRNLDGVEDAESLRELVDDALARVDSSTRELAIVLAAFDGAVSNVDAQLIAAEEGISDIQLAAAQLRHEGLLALAEPTALLLHELLRPAVWSYASLRKRLRLNARIAELYVEREDYWHASRHLLRAGPESKEAAIRMLVQHAWSVGDAGYAARARRVLEEALAEFRDPRFQYRAIAAMADLAVCGDLLADAEGLYSDVVSRSRKDSVTYDVRLESRVLGKIGLLKLDGGRVSAADETFRTSISRAETTNDAIGQALSLWHRGRTLTLLGRPSDALDAIVHAQTLWPELRRRADVLFDVAEALHADHRNVDAVQALWGALEILDLEWSSNVARFLRSVGPLSVDLGRLGERNRLSDGSVEQEASALAALVVEALARSLHEMNEAVPDGVEDVLALIRAINPDGRRRVAGRCRVYDVGLEPVSSGGSGETAVNV